MRILIFWDIFGRIWRAAFERELSHLCEQYTPSICIANIENITSWRGPVKEHAEYMEKLGVDLMTLWDHAFDNMESIWEYFEKKPEKIIRPYNFYGSLPGVGYQIIKKNGVRILVMQFLWEVFMTHNVQNPFHSIDWLLSRINPELYDISIVEFHKEVTAEFYGMLHHLKNRVSLVYGTHTHVQTADARIHSNYTAWICDIGMNGASNGVIGADFSSVKRRFLTWLQQGKIEQNLEKNYQINAIVCDFDTWSWACTDIQPISFLWSL